MENINQTMEPVFMSFDKLEITPTLRVIYRLLDFMDEESQRELDVYIDGVSVIFGKGNIIIGCYFLPSELERIMKEDIEADRLFWKFLDNLKWKENADLERNMRCNW